MKVPASFRVTIAVIILEGAGVRIALLLVEDGLGISDNDNTVIIYQSPCSQQDAEVVEETSLSVVGDAFQNPSRCEWLRAGPF